MYTTLSLPQAPYLFLPESGNLNDIPCLSNVFYRLLRDWLFKDSRRGRVFPVIRPRKGVREAVLEYRIVRQTQDACLAEITLHTGRTHQIRVQFASRKHPLWGDGKYGSRVKGAIALQSCGLQFVHPDTGRIMNFTLPLPDTAPWNLFAE